MIQNKNFLCIKSKNILKKIRAVRLIIILILEPILSSKNEKTKHPANPERLMKIPKKISSLEEKLNSILAYRLAYIKIQITPLLNKK